MSLLRDSPWFAAVAAAALDGWVLYVLMTGRIAIDKKGTFVATRSGDPGTYWLVLLLLAVFGGLLTWHAVRSFRR
jgi:hypothetical protein